MSVSVGKAVTVTVAGFGTKSGIFDRMDSLRDPCAPYHITFQDGQSGWFSRAQIRFDDGKAPEATDIITALAAQMVSNPRPYAPHPPLTEEDEWDEEETQVDDDEKNWFDERDDFMD